MGESVRLRLVFEDAGILRSSQRRRGLQRCWFELPPGIFTIADLAAHLQMTFALHGSCPHGLIISMDDFVLPSFISTSILKDKDIIMIKKNGDLFQGVVKFCDSQNKEEVLQSRENSAFRNRNMAIMFPQVNLHDENDTVLFDRSLVHFGTLSKKMNERCKRKRSNELQGFNNTLVIKDSQGDLLGDEENVDLHGNIANTETASIEMVLTKRKKKRSNEFLNSDTTLAARDSQRDSPGDENEVSLHNVNIPLRETPFKITNVMKRKQSNMFQAAGNISKENEDGDVSKNDAIKDTKLPSRSARRKKAKKLFYRTFGSKKEKKMIFLFSAMASNSLSQSLCNSIYFKKAQLIRIASPKSDKLQKTVECANADKNIKADEESVPDIVRPGHIRFESPDTCSVRADEPEEIFQWNGTASKKKGRKWGRENAFNKWNGDTSNWLSYGESSNATEAELVEFPNERSFEEVETYRECIVNHVEPVKECNGNSIAKEFEAFEEPIEFESLLPLIRLPEEGDVLAYRIAELSWSWCPELSPFRVGRVLSYDSISSEVILVPLPEYPFILEEISEEGQESTSLYKEDGTLEVNFASLVDVRLFKARESIETTPNTYPIEEMQNAAPLNNQESASSRCNRIGVNSNHTVNYQLTEGWEAINQALNEKKSQLQKQKESYKRNSNLVTATISPWSYRALRRNALGPTLAMLSSNGDIGK